MGFWSLGVFRLAHFRSVVLPSNGMLRSLAKPRNFFNKPDVTLFLTNSLYKTGKIIPRLFSEVM